MWRSGRRDTFVAVAEKLRFSRAAARLHVSQLPLSPAILALERELGVQRLHRNSRPASLAQTGDVLRGDIRLPRGSCGG
ncbi:LysR family transcriptional regulator [Streptomyces canus]|uniref:LysR family transcriptional regulator n=1 Tax=Streptomyces canus TaxID=58343 RepID=UPI0036CC3AD8